MLRAANKNYKIVLTLDWDDQLRNNGQYFSAALFKHIENTLDGEETVGVLLLADTFKEDWEVMMVVKLHNVDFPENSVLLSMLNCNWEVTTIIETSEFAWDNSTGSNGTCTWLLNWWLRNWL